MATFDQGSHENIKYYLLTTGFNIDPRHGGMAEAYYKHLKTVIQERAEIAFENEPVRQVTDIKYAAGGPGTGTHGWADAGIYLVPNRTFQGYWDYSETTSLVPNMTGTGEYDIYDVDVAVNRFINRVPAYSTATGFNRLQSSDTSRLPNGYYLRGIVRNGIVPGDWKCWMFMTLHRERTI